MLQQTQRRARTCDPLDLALRLRTQLLRVQKRRQKSDQRRELAGREGHLGVKPAGKMHRSSRQSRVQNRVLQFPNGGNGELGAVGVGGSEGAGERDEELEMEGEGGFFFEETPAEKEDAKKSRGFEVETVRSGVRRPGELLAGRGRRRRGRRLVDLHGGLLPLPLLSFFYWIRSERKRNARSA